MMGLMVEYESASGEKLSGMVAQDFGWEVEVTSCHSDRAGKFRSVIVARDEIWRVGHEGVGHRRRVETGHVDRR